MRRLRRRTGMQSLAAQGKMRLSRRLEVEVLAFALAYRTVRQFLACQRSNQNALGIHQGGGSGRVHPRRRTRARGVAQFLPQHRRFDSQAMRDLVGPLVAHDAAGYPLNVRQQIIQGLHFAFGSARGKQRARALNQVIEIFLRVGKRLVIRRLLPCAE